MRLAILAAARQQARPGGQAGSRPLPIAPCRQGREKRRARPGPKLLPCPHLTSLSRSRAAASSCPEGCTTPRLAPGAALLLLCRAAATLEDMLTDWLGLAPAARAGPPAPTDGPVSTTTPLVLDEPTLTPLNRRRMAPPTPLPPPASLPATGVPGAGEGARGTRTGLWLAGLAEAPGAEDSGWSVHADAGSSVAPAAPPPEPRRGVPGSAAGAGEGAAAAAASGR